MVDSDRHFPARSHLLSCLSPEETRDGLVRPSQSNASRHLRPLDMVRSLPYGETQVSGRTFCRASSRPAVFQLPDGPRPTGNSRVVVDRRAVMLSNRACTRVAVM